MIKIIGILLIVCLFAFLAAEMISGDCYWDDHMGEWIETPNWNGEYPDCGVKEQ